MIEVEMEAAVLKVLGDRPMLWRAVVSETKLHPAKVSQILERLKLRNQVVLEPAGYVLAPPASKRTALDGTAVSMASTVSSASTTGPVCSVCRAPLTEENWTPGARKMGWRRCRQHLRRNGVAPVKQIKAPEAVVAAQEPALTPEMRSQLRSRAKRKYTRRTPTAAPSLPKSISIVPVTQAPVPVQQPSVSMRTALNEVGAMLEGYRDRLTEAIDALRKL